MKKTILVSAFAVFAVFFYAGTMDFAQFLFNEHDYFRTVTQLKKAYYENEITDTLKLKNLLGVCYVKMGDYKTALFYFDEIKDESEFARNNYFNVLFLMENHIQLKEIEALNDKQENIKTLSLLFNDELDRKTFENENEEISLIAEEYFNIQKKNPALAMLFSAIIPGMGRIYADRLGDGLFSLSTIILPAVATYFYYRINNDYLMYGAAALTGIFYLGELYGAFNSAGLYFTSHRKVYYETVINNNYSVLSIDYSF